MSSSHISTSDRLSAIPGDAPHLFGFQIECGVHGCVGSFIGHGRTYGGGLHKLEPKELANLPAGVILDALPTGTIVRSHHQLSLFGT